MRTHGQLRVDAHDEVQWRSDGPEGRAHTRAVNVSSRLPGLVGLVVGVAAALLMLVGLGVPVGAGLLVGLVLGFVIVLAVTTRPPAGMVSFLRTRPGGPEPDHELIMRHGRAQMAVGAIDASDLRGVLTSGTAVEAANVRVELDAVELRADGGIGSLVARARPPASIGHFLEVSVTDDVGTAYTSAGQGSGSPNPAVGRIELRFAPAPPPAARRLTLRIDAFLDPFPGPARRLAGPWAFDLDLPADGA